MKQLIKKMSHGRLEPLFYFVYKIFVEIEYVFLSIKWWLQGYRKPKQEEIRLVVKNVTFIFKSFERQHMAKRLYKKIQSYYPGVKVIIADDSSQPLQLKGKSLTVIQLPFNS